MLPGAIHSAMIGLHVTYAPLIHLKTDPTCFGNRLIA